MKRFLLLSMVFCLVFFSIPCLAEVKIDEFQKAEGVIYEYDDMTETLSVKPDVGLIDLLVDGKAAIMPMIASGERSGKTVYMFCLYLISVSEDSITPQGAIIKTDNHRYLINVAKDSTDSEYKGGRYIEAVFFVCGSTALGMIEDMLSSSAVKLRIDGATDVDFELSETQFTALKNMYIAYKNAGCTEQDLSAFDIMAPITVK